MSTFRAVGISPDLRPPKGPLDGLAVGTQQAIDTIDALDPLFVLGGGDYA